MGITISRFATCGKARKLKDDGIWFCSSCHNGDNMDDAQWIQLMKKMETVYGKDKLEGRYPVWWNQVVK